MINIEEDSISNIVLGSTNIKKVYEGTELVWEKPQSDFITVDYIQNNSTAYIDTRCSLTGYSPSTFEMILDVDILQNESAWRSLFGSRYKSGDVDTCMVQIDNSNRWYTQINGTAYRITSIPRTGRHTIRVANSMIYIDNVAFTSAKTIPRFSAAYMYLLEVHNRNDDSIGSQGPICKVYSCQMSNNGTVLRNYVPAFQISTQKYGLLDKTHNVFYISPNGTLFTGPDVT